MRISNLNLFATVLFATLLTGCDPNSSISRRAGESFDIGTAYDAAEGPKALALSDNGKLYQGIGTTDAEAKAAALSNCAKENLPCRIINLNGEQINDDLNPKQAEMLRLVRAWPEICQKSTQDAHSGPLNKCVDARLATWPTAEYQRHKLAVASYNPAAIGVMKFELDKQCQYISGQRPAICDELAKKE